MIASLPAAVLRLAALVVSLTSLTEGQVLIGHGDGPRLTSAFVTLIPLADRGVGLPGRAAGSVVHAREATVLLTGYGATAVSALRTLSTLLWSDAPEMFEAVGEGLAIREVSSVSDQTAIAHTSYEPRAALTVTVGYVATPEADGPPAAEQVRVGVEAVGVLGPTADVIVEPPDEPEPDPDPDPDPDPEDPPEEDP